MSDSGKSVRWFKSKITDTIQAFAYCPNDNWIEVLNDKGDPLPQQDATPTATPAAEPKAKPWESSEPAQNEQPAAGAEELAKKFHDTYERLAPSFGYTTREETRQFNPDSPNGKLMIAVCDEIEESITAELVKAETEAGRFIKHWHEARNEIDRLVAELAELQKKYERLDADDDQVMRERDGYHDMLDKFVSALGGDEVHGEHSNLNDPWQSALDFAEELMAKAGDAESDYMKAHNETVQANKERDEARRELAEANKTIVDLRCQLPNMLEAEQRWADMDRELAEAKREMSEALALNNDMKRLFDNAMDDRDAAREANIELAKMYEGQLAEAKERHERELFDCGGINDAWAMEVDKLKAELAEAKRERQPSLMAALAHEQAEMIKNLEAEREAARAEAEQLQHELEEIADQAVERNEG